MKKTVFLVGAGIALIVIGAYYLCHKEAVSLRIDQVHADDTYLSVSLNITNNTKQDITFAPLFTPLEHHFTLEDLSDPTSVMTHLPVSFRGRTELVLPAGEKKTFTVNYLAQMTAGNHRLRISLVDSDGKALIQTIGEIHVDHPIRCENFSKSEFQHE